MTYAAYINHNRQTCIVYSTDDGLVRAVRMESPELGLLEMGYDQFHSQWAAIVGCDVVAAAHKYLEGLIPYSETVKSILEKITMGSAENVAQEATEAPAAKTVKKGKGKSGPVEVTKKAPAKKAVAAAEKKTKEFFAKQEAKKAATAPAAKAKGKATAAEPKERKPREDIGDKVITLLEGSENKKFQEGSVRSLCFATIKSGMKVKAYLAAVAKKGICDEKAAIGCLNKLADANQKTQTVSVE